MPTTDAPLVALICATPASLPAVRSAFADVFPQARLWTVLDDRLQQEAEERGGVTPELAQRMHRLVDHAVVEGADAVLLTCSLYGPLAPGMAGTAPVPVLAPDAASFAAVLDSGYHDVLVLGSAQGSTDDAVLRLQQDAAARRTDIQVRGATAADAAPAALSGDLEGLTAALVRRVLSEDRPPQAVVLAQYSLAPVAEQLTQQIAMPVFAGPLRAALALRARLGMPLTADPGPGTGLDRPGERS